MQWVETLGMFDRLEFAHSVALSPLQPHSLLQATLRVTPSWARPPRGLCVHLASQYCTCTHKLALLGAFLFLTPNLALCASSWVQDGATRNSIEGGRCGKPH